MRIGEYGVQGVARGADECVREGAKDSERCVMGWMLWKE